MSETVGGSEGEGGPSAFQRAQPPTKSATVKWWKGGIQ